MKVQVNWKEALAFDAIGEDGHTVRIDTSVENGGLNSGMNPKRLLLASLCGCSAIDVIEILNKMKVAFTKLEVTAEADQTDTVPKTFTHIDLVYHCDVQAEDEDKLKRAVSLSMDKYCGVSAMLAKHCPINYSTKLI
jgi:putative redox protein